MTCARPRWLLDATLTAVGPGGATRIPVAEFFVDYFTTALQPDEILVDVRIPKHTDWGRTVREVQPGRAGLVDCGGSRDG